jgi:hypothetical protein
VNYEYLCTRSKRQTQWPDSIPVRYLLSFEPQIYPVHHQVIKVMFHWLILETNFDIITPDELKARRAKNPNWGVDLVIDCSGYAPAMEEALLLINPGGKLCIFGVTSPQARIR